MSLFIATVLTVKRFQENLTPPGSPNSRLLADTEAQYVNYREEKPLQGM